MKKYYLFVILLFGMVINAKALDYSIGGYKTIGLNTTQKLYLVNGSNSINDSALWSSSNENIATVDNGGIVTGFQLGKTTISAKYLNKSSLTVIKGDVNFDGVLDHKDITRMIKYLNNVEDFSQAQLLVGDVNGNNIVDSEDSTMIENNTGENAPGGEAPLGTVNIPYNTDGIALYFDSYAEANDLNTVTYEVEVVDQIRTTSIDEVIAAFKSTDDYAKYNTNGCTTDIKMVGNELVITYTNTSDEYIYRYGVYNGIISYSTGDSTEQDNDLEVLANAGILGWLTEAILLSAGYSQDYIDSINILEATVERNGIKYTCSEDSNGYLSLDSFSFYVDLGHLYLSDDLKYDLPKYRFVDFENAVEAIESEEVVTTTKQETIENPKTGINIPVLELGAMFAVAAGCIYCANKKKKFKRF